MREYTCIICPNGCDTRARVEERGDGTERICSVEGVAYPKGRAYVEQEITAPHRNVATSASVKGGILPLANVKLANPIPRNQTFDIMGEIKRCTLAAPVKMGTVVIPHLLGYNANVIVTKPMPENECR